jgi:hypothetical protein
MRTLRAALLLLLLVPAAVPDASADVCSTFAAFAQRLTVRMGVAKGSLVVLPLVLGEGVPDGLLGPGLALPGPAASWQQPPESTILVDVASGDADGAPPRLLPTGTILTGGERELVTLRPSVVAGAAPVRLSTTPSDAREKPAAPAEHRVGARVAPLGQRKLLLVGRREGSLSLLQRVEALLAGLKPECETLTDVLDSAFCADAERIYMEQLAKIPKAYAGRSVGHIAFFGFRPVEIVAFARSADYQSVGPAYLRSLAVSHAFWAEVLGTAGNVPAEGEIRKLVGEATVVVESLARVNPRAAVSANKEESPWKLFTAPSQSDIRPSDHTEDFLCRFAVDEKGAVVHLEAIESGSDLVFPPPYREPGGRPVGDPPSNKGGGVGYDSLQRILDRMRQNRGR